jgi:hypothetical protein
LSISVKKTQIRTQIEPEHIDSSQFKSELEIVEMVEVERKSERKGSEVLLQK